MAPSHESVINSRPVRFLVGLERKEFTIHSALIERHSTPIYNMVKRCTLNVKGDENLPVVLEKVAAETFVRFSEFAYTGNYTATEPQSFWDLAGVKNHIPQLVEFVNANGGSHSKKRKTNPTDSQAFPDSYQVLIQMATNQRCQESVESLEESLELSIPRSQKLKSTLWSDFKKLKFLEDGPAFKQNIISRSAVYHEVFLCHACVYVFAIKFGIEALLTLSLHKLHQALVNCPPTKAHHVVPAIVYTYWKTLKSTRDGRDVDPLRSLFTHFTACFIEYLVLSPRFLWLLKEGGDFPKDLIQNRLSSLG